MFGVALWPIVIVALRAPVAVGLKVMSTGRSTLGERTAGAQVPVRVNLSGLVPPSVIVERTRLAEPLLVSVADIVPEVVCTTWLPKLSLRWTAWQPGSAPGSRVRNVGGDVGRLQGRNVVCREKAHSPFV